jgi:ribosome-binding ATPase YchF (GTP1/OBG family)
VNAHAALPDCEDLERVLNEVRRLIKETVSDTAAQHDTQNAIEKQILKRVFPRQTAPLLLLANTAKKIEKRETDQVHEAVPMHGQRPYGKSDRIELRMHPHGSYPEKKRNCPF